MKNIFILPTDEPSKLFIIDKSKMYVPELPYLSFSAAGGKVHKIEGSEIYQPQLIYITNEEKPNLYAIGKDGGIDKVFKYPLNNSTNKNIVLTNDPKLIADGVQELTEEQIINTMHQVELEDDKDYSKLFNRVLQKLNEL